MMAVQYRMLSRDEELAALRAGDYATLVESQMAWVKSLARKIHSRFRQIDLDELVSAGNLGLYESVRKYDGRTRLNTFVTRAIRWRMLTLVREGKRSHMHLLGDSTPGLPAAGEASDQAIQAETAERVRGMVSRLPDLMRRVMELRYLSERSIDETSEQIRLPIDRVRQIEQQAIGELRKMTV